jgi:predicted SAM-dependent methyltransferase
MEWIATEGNFDEELYLLANPDVAIAVERGLMPSGRAHFESFGKKESRKIKLRSLDILEAKTAKLEKIKPFLRTDMASVRTPNYHDFLTEDLRRQFNIIDTDAVSSHGYDAYAMQLIDGNANGMVLDCGAGKRPVYFDNVVNFEIADYETTDVRGVGEVLPFIDGTFDAVLSLAVLEHVKDPFQCAREIARVLKPGGRLMCCVPFLQPAHGYPHHYYNMTSQGIRNLFDDSLTVDDVVVYESISPIWALTWILQSWSAGLGESTRKDFMNMKIGDLMGTPESYLSMPFVKELTTEKNLELACATVLFAHK